MSALGPNLGLVDLFNTPSGFCNGSSADVCPISQTRAPDPFDHRKSGGEGSLLPQRSNQLFRRMMAQADFGSGDEPAGETGSIGRE
jgi:hypothetical protein